MSNFEFDATDFINKLTVSETKALDATLTSMHDITDDLKRISSDIAPIKDSGLRKSVNTIVELSPGGIIGEVHFSVIEKTGERRFNYAQWIHEMEYELGEQSKEAPGTDGYEVGNKYLERPLKGEAEKYMKWQAEAVAKVLD